MSVNLNKEIWEGWTVQDFIDELEPSLDAIMSGRSYIKPFKTKSELTSWCTDNQPYYKKAISDVSAYFAQKYSIR